MLLHCRVANILDCLFNYTASPGLTPTYRTVRRPWTIWKVPLQGNGPTQQRIRPTALCMNGYGTWATWFCYRRFGCFRLLPEVSRNGHIRLNKLRVQSCMCEWAFSLLNVHQPRWEGGKKTFPRATRLLQCQYKPIKQYIPLLSRTHTHTPTLYIY